VDSLLNRNITLQNNNQKDEYDYVNKFQKLEIQAHRKLLFFNEKIKFVLSWICIIMSITLFTYIFDLMINKKISLSNGFFLFSILFILVRSVWSIGSQLGPFVEALGQCNKGIFYIRNMYKIIENKPIQKFDPSNYSVEFRNVTVYDRDRPLIKNISFKIENGEKVVFLGHSGSGKTTILRTLLGLTEQYTGDIFIGDINLKNVDMKEVRDIIGILDQKSYVFARTIDKNITVTNHNATLKDLKQVTEAAKLYDFIENLPNKFEEKVNINRFSGGQLQKICLARFFLKQGKIQLFDEFSTGLDIIAQKEIIDYIKNFNSSTCLFVDHNLSYLHLFNKIILLREGEILGQGTHE
jgi:ABC-type multidrug transport system fused ATPase/permease subunit